MIIHDLKSQRTFNIITPQPLVPQFNRLEENMQLGLDLSHHMSFWTKRQSVTENGWDGDGERWNRVYLSSQSRLFHSRFVRVVIMKCSCEDGRGRSSHVFANSATDGRFLVKYAQQCVCLYKPPFVTTINGSFGESKAERRESMTN